MTEKIRENRLRRMAKRQDFHLVKSTLRDQHAVGYGCYDLIDVGLDNGVSMFGLGPTGQPKATLDEIEEFLNGKGTVWVAQNKAHREAMARLIGLDLKTGKRLPRRKKQTT